MASRSRGRAKQSLTAAAQHETLPKKAQHKLNPTAITPAEAAALLSRTGGVKITTSMIETDIASGAPTNADQTINLLHYTAWLLANQEQSHKDR